MRANRRLPADSTLLPIPTGQLLVSPGHAVFGAVPSQYTAVIRRAMAGEVAIEELDHALLDNLEEHGFFGDPRPAEPDSPSVQLQLTNECNLACSYCCTSSGGARPAELEFSDFAEVVRQAQEVLGPNARVALLGGEPLLVPWAIDLAELVIDLGLRLTLFSNGLRLNDTRLAKRVAALTQRGGELRVSLAGPNEALCDAVSQAPRFQAVICGLAELAHHGGTAMVDLMLLPDHVGSVAAELPELRRLLPNDTTIAFGVAYLGGREKGEHIFGSRGELETALDRITFEAGERIEAPRPAPVAYRREGCTCTLGRHLHVRSDGSLFTCFKMEEKVGDLAGASFAQTLERCQTNIQPASLLEECASCPLATLCGGGCRSENLLYTGDPDKPACGPWRVSVLSELLAEDRVGALHWPVSHLAAEAVRRGIKVEGLLPPTLR